MRSHILPGLVAAALLIAGPACAEGFLTVITDVPLMDGLAETSDPVVFETDRGRVVSTVTTGQISPGRIERFYADALPALGWTRDGDMLAFVRGSERLTIQIREPASSAPVRVTFELVAKLASSSLPE